MNDPVAYDVSANPPLAYGPSINVQPPYEAAASEPVAYDYATFPRQFVSYRWFKPIFVFLLAVVFMIIFQVFIGLIVVVQPGGYQLLVDGGSYEGMDVTTALGSFYNFAAIAVMWPALALALLIVQDRPYSSLSSSRGGWNWTLFAKSLGVAAIVSAVFFALEVVLFPDDGMTGINSFTVGGFVMLTILCPFQCLAEEYVFRGFFLQTFGSWTKFPPVAIALAAAVFAAGHPYNMIGVVSIFVTGIVWGIVAWMTKGLEVSTAAHIVNNLLSFYLVGFGIAELSSEIDVVSAVWSGAMDVVFAVAIILIGRKFDWFAATKDGAFAFNAKKRPKYEYKAWVKEQKRFARQGIYPNQQVVYQSYGDSQQVAYQAQPYGDGQPGQPVPYQAQPYGASQPVPYQVQPYGATQSVPYQAEPYGTMQQEDLTGASEAFR